MVSLLQDLYIRFRYARGSGPWRNYIVSAIGLGFLITLYRAYSLHPWSMYSEETEFDVPDPHVNWDARANAVKEAFVHAYHGYETHAFPEDELLPLTNTSAMK